MRVQAGLFRKSGTASFDDVRLVDLEEIGFEPINTSWGEPADGLEVATDQLGMFDPSYPLRRGCRVRTSPGQDVVTAEVQINEPIEGWAASGVVGNDQARWIPLLEVMDRYGRPRGPAPCQTQADCANACPPGAARGCRCAPTPHGGNACIPACSSDADCPTPPGMSLRMPRW